MLATFEVKNSTVHFNESDISGLSNKVEVTLMAKTDHQPTGRLNGKVEVVIKQKTFFSKLDIERVSKVCQEKGTYKFTREKLQYTIEDAEVNLLKMPDVAGVTPVDLTIGGSGPLTRIWISN